MGAYAVKRLLQGIPTLLGVTLVTFILLNVFGGDPVRARLGKSATEQDVTALRQEYGLDKSLPRQYLRFLQEVITLDFGRTFVTREPVDEVILRSLGPSISITLPALILTTLISLTVALIAAFNRGKPIDRGLVVLAVIGMSVSFLVYIVAGQYFLGYKLRWFQVYGYDSGWIGRWQYLFLPILVQVIVAVGYDVRFYRAVMVEETGRQHVTTARAKGLALPMVMFKHVLRNAMIPIVTRVMITVPFLITGSVLVETFFGIPGLGLKILTAINEQDYPLIKAVTVLVSVLFIVVNVLTDLLYAVFDPRVRLR